MKFAILNESTQLAAPEYAGACAKMANACDLQILNDAGPAWGRYGSVTYYPDAASVPDDVDVRIVLFDTPDAPDALGYHDEQDDVAYGHVFVDPVLANDGSMLGNDGASLSVSSVLSHEVLETLVDPYVNGWWGRQDGSLIAAELCDPVESDGYRIDVLGTPVLVSNFILPRWSDVQATQGPFDQMGTTQAPFAMSPGGYLIVQVGGAVSQVFGAKMPEFRRRAARRRLARRIAKNGLRLGGPHHHGQ